MKDWTTRTDDDDSSGSKSRRVVPGREFLKGSGSAREGCLLLNSLTPTTRIHA